MAMAGIAWCWLGGFAGSAQAAVDAAASAKCIECHEEDHQKMARSAHAVSADPRTPTCVTCHGASEKHVARKGRVAVDITFRGEAAQSAEAASAICASCHEKGAKQMLWATSAHPAAGVACNNCHRTHVNQDRVLAKATEAEVCYACHKQQRGKVDLPSRHPIAEGRMSCSDCHNAHGSTGPALAKRDSTNATCYTCHAEKRGPFVHQHQPVTEDCAACHNPHGSAIPGMLKARAPILCQQCHTPHLNSEVGALAGQPGVIGGAVTGTSSGKNVVNQWQGRSCMNCHTQVHGSNNPATTGPTPQYMFR